MILDQNLSRQLLPEKRDSIFQVSETQTCHMYQDDSLHNAGRTLSLNLAAQSGLFNNSQQPRSIGHYTKIMLSYKLSSQILIFSCSVQNYCIFVPSSDYLHICKCMYIPGAGQTNER